MPLAMTRHQLNQHNHPDIARAQRTLHQLARERGNEFLAERFGISIGTVQQIMRGKKLPAPGLCREIADFLLETVDPADNLSEQIEGLRHYALMIERDGFPGQRPR